MRCKNCGRDIKDGDMYIKVVIPEDNEELIFDEAECMKEYAEKEVIEAFGKFIANVGVNDGE